MTVEGCGSIERCSFKKAATAPGLWAVLTPGGSTCWMVWGRSFCLGILTWIFSGTQVTHASFHMENGGIFGRARLTPCIVGMFAGIFFLLLMLQKSGEKTTERMVLKSVENHGIKQPTSTGDRRISEPATIIKHGGLERENSFKC